MKRMLMGAAVLLLMGAGAAPATGQVRFGAQVDFADDVDMGIGVRALKDLDQYLTGMDGYLAFDLFFPGENQSYWEINGNVTFPIPMSDGGTMSPYFGGGLRLARYGVDVPGFGEADDTELGLNLLVGSQFASRGKWAPFVELRLPLGGLEGVDFILAVGIYF
ncbi:hypothetical protein ACFL4Y_04235 [Gemmatimonadota bacterium]